MIDPLATKRLYLRPLELGDAEQTQLLFPHWEIVRYLNERVPWPYPPDGAYTHIRDEALPAMERGEQWHWSLFPKNAPEQLIGRVSLLTGPDNNRGFWIGLPWQRQGLMTEACDAITGYWFDVLQFPLLRIPKAACNLASRHISEKQGMRVVSTEERRYVCGFLFTEVWKITAEEWRAREKGRAD